MVEMVEFGAVEVEKSLVRGSDRVRRKQAGSEEAATEAVWQIQT